MLQLRQLLHEGLQAPPPFLHEGHVAIADHFLDGQGRHEAARPTRDKVRSAVVEVAVSSFVLELALPVPPLHSVDRVCTQARLLFDGIGN